MIQSCSWKPDQHQLFFFDKEKKNHRWKKRQKKPIDSLPVALLRDTRVSVTFAGDKLASYSKGKKDLGQIREEGEGGQSDSEKERKFSSSRTRLDLKLMDLEYDEDEDTQRFLFEEEKFSAPSLLAQIEKYLILLMQQKAKQKEELEQLNEEIEATYGTPWGQGVPQERNSFLDLPDDLYNSLCYDFEQFASGTVYVTRKWQTNVYRELAASSHSLVDFQSNMSSPEIAVLRSPNEKQRIPLEEKERKFDGIKAMSATVPHDGKIMLPDPEMPPIASTQREPKMATAAGKPKARLDKLKVTAERDKGDKDKALRAKRMEQNENIEEESAKVPESGIERNLDNHSQGSKKKDVTGSSSAGHKSDTLHHDTSVYNQGQSFVPGTVINFSLASKLCHEKGWVCVKSGIDDLEQKSLIEWILSRLRQVLRRKEEEETKARLCNDNKPLIQRCYGDSKREATIKYKQGVALAKLLSQKKDETSAQLFLTTLPDGSICSFYPSGNVAVICVKCKAGNQSFYTIAYSDEPNARTLACFTPQGRGFCNYSEKVIRFLVTKKEAIFNDENGMMIKKWKWAYGKMLNPEVLYLSENISIRCVSQNSIVLTVNIEGEVAKFPVSPFSDAPEQDLDNLGHLMTSEVFSSRGAAQSYQPRKKTTKEEKRTKAQKRDNFKSGINEEWLAERRKDIEEKFPERQDVDFDAPYLIELYKIQRKVRNIVFDWMEHYRSAVGISRPSKLSLLMKKRARITSASSLPESMPSFPKLSTTYIKRRPSAPPGARSSAASMEKISEESSRKLIFPDNIFEGSFTEMVKHMTEEPLVGLRIELPQLPKSAESGRQGISTPHTYAKPQTSESARLKTARPLLLPKDGCPVALHLELLGTQQTQCRCDKRRIPFIMDLEYDVFIQEHVPKTQLIVISIISSRFPRMPRDVMLDDLYYEKHKAQTLICAQSQFDPFRLLRYDLATAAPNKELPLLVRRHNVAPGMFLMYAGGKLLFADYIFNGYGNEKRDLLNQIMRTRKESVACNGLAQDFRFTTGPEGREPRTAWGGEIEVPIPLDIYARTNTVDSYDGFPALIPIILQERDRRKIQTGLMTYNRISNLLY